jgi:hypothetical protein
MVHQIKEQLKQFYKNPTSVQYEHHSSRGTYQQDMRVLPKLWAVYLKELLQQPLQSRFLVR